MTTVSVAWAGGVFFQLGLLPVWGSFGAMLPPTIWRKREAVPWLPANVVLLTFDDGPNAAGRTTARLLDVLDREKVTAAFCLTGYAVERAPALVQRMRDSGHLLVNHTYAHRPGSLWRVQELAREIRRCDEAIALACGEPGYRSNWFRPPGGWMTRAVRTCAEALRVQILPVTHFAFDTWCTRRGARRLVAVHLRVAKRDRGGVFVVHDGLVRLRPFDRACDLLPGNNRAWVPGAVTEMIHRLRAEGMECCVPDEVRPRRENPNRSPP